MTQDLSHYDTDYYISRDIHETWFWRNGLLRPDQLAAICYAFGRPFFGEPTTPREPGPTVSVGCGRGELEAALEQLGVDVLGYDPALGAAELYAGRRFTPHLPLAELADASTVIFCESIEHIPAEQTMQIRGVLRPGCRLIVVNWLDYHPLHPDGSGWDHIALVDDNYFARLAKGATTVLRRGAHLVLDAAA